MPSSEVGLWLFAGCNGAGKSTFIESATSPGGILFGAEVLNPDRLTKQRLEAAGYTDYSSVPPEVYAECFVRAAGELEAEAEKKLKAKGLICIETVLSTDKYLRLVEVALQAGIPFRLVYVALNSPDLSRQRVANRVAHGGHPVPDSKIVPRYHRSLANFIVFARKATHFWFYDNSDSSKQAPTLLFEGNIEALTTYRWDFDPWAAEILREVTLSA